MNKYLLTIALFGFSSMSLSAAKIPSRKGHEVSMSQSTQKEKKEEKEATKDSHRKEMAQLRNGYTTNGQEQENGDITAPRKSAAQKVLEGK